MDKLKNKNGSLSVEALISVSMFLLVIAVLISLLTLISTEERIDQYSYDLLNELEIYNYLYEKVGFDEIVDLSLYKEKINQYLEEVPNIPKEYLEVIRLDKWAVSESKEMFLSNIFKRELEKELLKYNRYTSLKNYKFKLDGNLVKVSYLYDVTFPMEFKLEVSHSVEKVFWLFGDEGDIYPNVTLVSKLKKEESSEKSIMVYKTKTGTKYHTIDCFYIVRSTTDKKNVIGITLDIAKYKYNLEPCSRCMKGK